MSKPLIKLNHQVVDSLKSLDIPSSDIINTYCQAVGDFLLLGNSELTIRITDDKEMIEINEMYRNKDKSTNVLSFPFEPLPVNPMMVDYDKCLEIDQTSNYLGDLVISHPYLVKEAKVDNKVLTHHYAHMVIHGILHLLGYDHIENQKAEKMESLEVNILKTLNIANPYQ